MSKANANAKPEQKSSRIIALDLLRGYFLISIILNHLQWYPNGLDWVAARGSLFVTAAEGFFFISGILLGIIRGRKLLDKPFRVAATLMLNRGLQLYVTSIILMLFFTFIGWFFIDNPGLKPGIRPPDQPLHEILLGAFSLQYLYGWADYLRLYAIFIIMSPLALWLLRKGKWYILITGSIGLWALFPFAYTSTGRSAELLMPLSWQLIFFIGLTIGFYWPALQKRWDALAKRTRAYILGPILTIAVATIIANVILAFTTGFGGNGSAAAQFYNEMLASTFNKDSLTPLRILLFGTWFSLGLFIVMRYEKQIIKWAGWILLPFGKNSLYVYTLHAVLLFFAHLIIPPDSSNNLIINFIGSVLILVLILFAVKKRFLFKIIPR